MFIMPIKALRFEGTASVSSIVTATFLTEIRCQRTVRDLQKQIMIQCQL